MTFHEIVANVRERFGSADTSGVKGKLAIQFNLTGEGSGIFYAEVLDGKLSIEPYEYFDRDAILTLSSQDLFELMEGRLDTAAAYTSGRLRVDGSLDKALELDRLIKTLAPSASKKAAPKKTAKPAKAQSAASKAKSAAKPETKAPAKTAKKETAEKK